MSAHRATGNNWDYWTSGSVTDINFTLLGCYCLVNALRSAYHTWPANLSLIIVKKLKTQGFIVFEHWGEYPAFVQQMGQWIQEGKVSYRETLYVGIESAPEAFMGLFTGKNIGKMLVKLT